ncbi:MAG: tetraacyldisaccharide 4'-kinase [Rubrivivax sp.]
MRPSHRRGGAGAALATRLQALWWQPQPRTATDRLMLALLWPLAALYRLASTANALPWRLGWRRRRALPVPVVVVGNLIVGGAGKTPVVIALIEALRARGWTPGVVSRGYGGQADGNEYATRPPRAVRPDDAAGEVGDEPLLIARRTSAPVWIGRRRPEAVHALCAAHPQVDVVISDDGLQHHALHRDAQWIVFDERGVGNGRLLPAGPLREPLPRRLPPGSQVLYTCDAPSTALPGPCTARQLGGLVPLQDWWLGHPARRGALDALRGTSVHAAAGIGHPSRFFSMLEAAGLQVSGIALPDHGALEPRPWPADAPCVIVTEKDAVKLSPQAADAAAVQVATLDLRLPDDLLGPLIHRLEPLRRR